MIKRLVILASLIGCGIALATQSVKTVNGLAIASVKTGNGLAVASVKTFADLDNTAPAGNITFVASASAHGNFTEATTSAIDTTGATLLVAVMGNIDNAAVVPTDSKGNTWTALTKRSGDNSSEGQIYYSIPTTVGTGHTFTTSGGTSNYCSMCVAAFADTNASPYEAESGAANASQPGSLTPAGNGSLLVAGIGYYTGDPSTINSSFTVAEYQNSGAGVNFGSGLAYLIQTTAAAVNPTWTGVSSGGCVMAVFKP